MGVLVQRQDDGAVPGQLLRVVRLNPGLHQAGDEPVPHGVEVRRPPLPVAIRQEVRLLPLGPLPCVAGLFDPHRPGHSEVVADEFKPGGVQRPFARPQPVLQGDPGHPRPQVDDEFGVQRHLIFTPVLAVGSLHRDRRRVGVEGERRRGETGQFARPEAGVCGHGVQRLPLWAAQPVPLLPGSGGREQQGELLCGQRATVLENAHGRVHLRQVPERVGQLPVRLHQPVAERLHRLRVVVAGGRAEPALALGQYPAFGQPPLGGGGVQVGELHEPAAGEQQLTPAGGLAGFLRRRLFVEQVPLVLG